MKVRILLIHPKKGIHDVLIENAPSVEDATNKLKGIGCTILRAEEEK